MAELGFKSEAAGWEARMFPLCYVAPLRRTKLKVHRYSKKVLESETFKERNFILEPVLVDNVHGEVDGVGHVDADHLRGAAVGAEHREDAGAAAEIENSSAGNLKPGRND